MTTTIDNTKPVRTAVYESPDASRVVEVYATPAYGRITLLTYCPASGTKHEAWGNWCSQSDPIDSFVQQPSAVRDASPADMTNLHAMLFLEGWQVAEQTPHN